MAQQTTHNNDFSHGTPWHMKQQHNNHHGTWKQQLIMAQQTTQWHTQQQLT